MVRSVQETFVSSTSACYYLDEAPKQVSAQRPKVSFAGRAYEALAGKPFDEATAPEMEYLVYEIFREASKAKTDFHALDFLFGELAIQAPSNLQPVVKKCLELAQKNPILTADLERRLQKLEERPFQSSEALGLGGEEQEIVWGRLGMIAAAALSGMLVLSALFGGVPPKKQAPAETAEEAPTPAPFTDLPCLPSEAPAQSNPVAPSPAPQLELLCLPSEAPASSAPATAPVTPPPASEPPAPSVKPAPVPPAAKQPSDSESSESRLDKLIQFAGLPPGMSRAQAEQTIKAAEARDNLRKFFEANRAMFGGPKAEEKPSAAAKPPVVAQPAPAPEQPIASSAQQKPLMTQQIQPIEVTSSESDPMKVTYVAVAVGLIATALATR